MEAAACYFHYKCGKGRDFVEAKPAIKFWGKYYIAIIILFLFPLSISNASTGSFITASIGKPNHGRLINGIPFPSDIGGYKLRSRRRSYTSPEVIGGVLDAIFQVQRKFPDTCDLQLGDFSLRGGGRFWPHKSHQNGRDVDIGMYAKHNRELPGLIRMTSRNLDVAKTWSLVEALLNSGNIQYIFLDLRLQRLLCRYARKHKVPEQFLRSGFQYASGCRYTAIVRHDGQHSTHLHVRFKAPWSRLAGNKWGHLSQEDRLIIASCQDAYLPRIKQYAVNKAMSLAEAAKCLNVTKSCLRKWNNIEEDAIPAGSVLKLYQIGYHPTAAIKLARLLRPEIFPSPSSEGYWPGSHLCSTGNVPFVLKSNKLAVSLPKVISSQKLVKKEVLFHWVKPGDTLSSISRRYGVSVYDLCRWNGLNRHSILAVGKRIRIHTGGKFARLRSTRLSFTGKSKVKNLGFSVYKIKRGDSLWGISRKLRVSLNALCKWNNISKKSLLKPGQRIFWKKPSIRNRKRGGTNKTVSPENKRFSHRVPRNQKQEACRKSNMGGNYTVKAGDSLWRIARTNGISVKELCKWNGIKPNSILRIGQKLKIHPFSFLSSS